LLITDTRGPGLRLSPDGAFLIAVSSNAVCRVWDTVALSKVREFPLAWTNTTAVAVGPGGKMAAFAVGDPEPATSRGMDRVLIWDLESNRLRHSGDIGTNFVPMLTFSPDGRQLVITLARELVFWNITDGTETARLSTAYFTRSLGFSPDGRRLAGGTYNGWVHVWDLTSPGRRREFAGHDLHIDGVAFASDGRTLLATGPDIRLWDTKTGGVVINLKPSTAGFHACALSADGKTFAVGHNDGVITLWSAQTHHQVGTLTGHNHRIEEIAFTPNGHTLVSVSQDELRAWRAAYPFDTASSNRSAK
jgi:WD40 repeat protein